MRLNFLQMLAITSLPSITYAQPDQMFFTARPRPPNLDAMHTSLNHACGTQQALRQSLQMGALAFKASANYDLAISSYHTALELRLDNCEPQSSIDKDAIERENYAIRLEIAQCYLLNGEYLKAYQQYKILQQNFGLWYSMESGSNGYKPQALQNMQTARQKLLNQINDLQLSAAKCANNDLTIAKKYIAAAKQIHTIIDEQPSEEFKKTEQKIAWYSQREELTNQARYLLSDAINSNDIVTLYNKLELLIKTYHSNSQHLNADDLKTLKYLAEKMASVGPQHQKYVELYKVKTEHLSIYLITKTIESKMSGKDNIVRGSEFADLQTSLSTLLFNNWYKFSKDGLPGQLQENLMQLIAAQVYSPGYLASFFTSAQVRLNDPATLNQQLIAKLEAMPSCNLSNQDTCAVKLRAYFTG